MTIMTIMTIKRDTVETTFAILAMFLQQKVLSQSRCTLAQEETVRRIMSSSAATSYSSPPTGAESGLSSSYEYIFIRSSQLCGLSNMDCIHGHGHVTVATDHDHVTSNMNILGNFWKGFSLMSVLKGIVEV